LLKYIRIGRIRFLIHWRLLQLLPDRCRHRVKLQFLWLTLYHPLCFCKFKDSAGVNDICYASERSDFVGLIPCFILDDLFVRIDFKLIAGLNMPANILHAFVRNDKTAIYRITIKYACKGRGYYGLDTGYIKCGWCMLTRGTASKVRAADNNGESAFKLTFFDQRNISIRKP